MKVGIAQINPRVGDFEYNFRQIKYFIEKGKAEHCKIVFFSELAMCGYMPEDALLSEDFHRLTALYLDKVKNLTEDIAIYIGYVEQNSGAGKPFFNSAVLFKDKKTVLNTRKRLLPNYGVFNENRYFEPAEDISLFRLDGVTFGLTICEDGWNTQFAKNSGTMYDHDPVKDVARAGADIIVNISASPFEYKKPAIREKMFSNIAAHYNKPLLLINQSGGVDGITFDGHSAFFDAEGQLIRRGKSFEADFFSVNLNESGKPHPDFDENRLIFDSLTCSLRDFIGKIGAKKVHFGLSGGIDSALVAVLSKYGLGANNVTGIMLPSMYSSEGSMIDSIELAENIGIHLIKIPISDMFQEAMKTLSPAVDTMKGITEENLQARIRGLLLMGYSNNENSILLNTGNKSELAVGYATIYGDMCGALSVIGDVYKTKVFDLCRWINREYGNIIPENIITKPPSAELRPDQKDEDSLPPYSILDTIIEMYVEKGACVDSIIQASGADGKTVQKVIQLIIHSEFKRKQAAPILKICEKAFPTGFRFPVSSGFNPFNLL